MFRSSKVRSDAVGGHVQMDGNVGRVKGFLGQPDIPGTVFDQKDF
jgi:hypothetical protein